jgi:hypothetical protein
MEFPRFTRNIAPVASVVEWEGATWDVEFRILSNEEELALIADAARGEDAQHNYLETLYRCARALHSICHVPILEDLDQRYKSAMGWLEPFTWQVAKGYAEAREKLLKERINLELDPNSAAGPEASGGASRPPANLPDDSLPPQSGLSQTITQAGTRLKRKGAGAHPLSSRPVSPERVKKP